MSRGKIQELVQEFRSVVMGGSNVLDTLIPTLVFLIVNSVFGFGYAMWTSLVLAALTTAVRFGRRQPIQYALGGLGNVVLAIVLARWFGRAEGYFLPAIANGALVFLATLVSVLVRRPLVAWTSYFARRWPLPWYWHPKVRPAYSEVTVLWALIFGLRLWLQIVLLQAEDPEAFATVTVLGGWPTTIVMLAISYLYGTWRLSRLGGPSVEEFTSGTPPPWQGQQSGF
jgi:hypothetical protein